MQSLPGPTTPAILPRGRAGPMESAGASDEGVAMVSEHARHMGVATSVKSGERAAEGWAGTRTSSARPSKSRSFKDKEGSSSRGGKEAAASTNKDGGGGACREKKTDAAKLPRAADSKEGREGKEGKGNSRPSCSAVGAHGAGNSKGKEAGELVGAKDIACDLDIGREGSGGFKEADKGVLKKSGSKDLPHREKDKEREKEKERVGRNAPQRRRSSEKKQVDGKSGEQMGFLAEGVAMEGLGLGAASDVRGRSPPPAGRPLPCHQYPSHQHHSQSLPHHHPHHHQHQWQVAEAVQHQQQHLPHLQQLRATRSRPSSPSSSRTSSTSRSASPGTSSSSDVRSKARSGRGRRRGRSRSRSRGRSRSGSPIRRGLRSSSRSQSRSTSRQRHRSISRSRSPPLYRRSFSPVPHAVYRGMAGMGGIGFRRGAVGGGPPPFWITTSRLAPDVRMFFQSLYEGGLLRPGDLEPACIHFLELLPPHLGFAVLNELCRLDLFRIRNLTAFFIGICKSIGAREGEPGRHMMVGAGGMLMSPMGGGRMPGAGGRLGIAGRGGAYHARFDASPGRRFDVGNRGGSPRRAARGSPRYNSLSPVRYRSRSPMSQGGRIFGGGAPWSPRRQGGSGSPHRFRSRSRSPPRCYGSRSRSRSPRSPRGRSASASPRQAPRRDSPDTGLPPHLTGASDKAASSRGAAQQLPPPPGALLSAPGAAGVRAGYVSGRKEGQLARRVEGGGDKKAGADKKERASPAESRDADTWGFSGAGMGFGAEASGTDGRGLEQERVSSGPPPPPPPPPPPAVLPPPLAGTRGRPGHKGAADEGGHIDMEWEGPDRGVGSKAQREEMRGVAALQGDGQESEESSGACDLLGRCGARQQTDGPAPGPSKRARYEGLVPLGSAGGSGCGASRDHGSPWQPSQSPTAPVAGAGSAHASTSGAKARDMAMLPCTWGAGRGVMLDTLLSGAVAAALLLPPDVPALEASCLFELDSLLDARPCNRSLGSAGAQLLVLSPWTASETLNGGVCTPDILEAAGSAGAVRTGSGSLLGAVGTGWGAAGGDAVAREEGLETSAGVLRQAVMDLVCEVVRPHWLTNRLPWDSVQLVTQTAVERVLSTLPRSGASSRYDQPDGLMVFMSEPRKEKIRTLVGHLVEPFMLS